MYCYTIFIINTVKVVNIKSETIKEAYKKLSYFLIIVILYTVYIY